MSALFDAETLRRFESARLLARRLARGRSRAERRSLARGAGVEFSEYRPLVAGDDFRHIDWHAYARWRQLVLKLFVQEEDLHVHFLLDCSLSMQSGAPPKFDQARRVLAGLAYIALGNLDRVGFQPLGPPGSRGIAPGRGRDRFASLLGALEDATPGGGSLSIEDGIRSWLAARPRRGLAVLVSDCFGVRLGDAQAGIDRIRHAGHEVAVVQMLAEDETEPPPPGEYELEDLEGGGLRRVIIDPAEAAAFRRRVRAFLGELDRAALSGGFPFLRAVTAEPLDAVLARALAWT